MASLTPERSSLNRYCRSPLGVRGQCGCSTLRRYNRCSLTTIQTLCVSGPDHVWLCDAPHCARGVRYANACYTPTTITIPVVQMSPGDTFIPDTDAVCRNGCADECTICDAFYRVTPCPGHVDPPGGFWFPVDQMQGRYCLTSFGEGICYSVRIGAVVQRGDLPAGAIVINGTQQILPHGCCSCPDCGYIVTHNVSADCFGPITVRGCLSELFTGTTTANYYYVTHSPPGPIFIDESWSYSATTIQNQSGNCTTSALCAPLLGGGPPSPLECAINVTHSLSTNLPGTQSYSIQACYNLPFPQQPLLLSYVSLPFSPIDVNPLPGCNETPNPDGTGWYVTAYSIYVTATTIGGTFSGYGMLRNAGALYRAAEFNISASSSINYTGGCGGGCDDIGPAPPGFVRMGSGLLVPGPVGCRACGDTATGGALL